MPLNWYTIFVAMSPLATVSFFRVQLANADLSVQSKEHLKDLKTIKTLGIKI